MPSSKAARNCRELTVGPLASLFSTGQLDSAAINRKTSRVGQSQRVSGTRGCLHGADSMQACSMRQHSDPAQAPLIPSLQPSSKAC